MQTLLAFLDRIEGHGYGGTAEFEIARTEAKKAVAALQKIANIQPTYEYGSYSYEAHETAMAALDG